MGVAWHHAAADDLEAGGEHVEIAERAVGDAAKHAEGEMHGGLHFTPEGAEAGEIVDVLQQGHGRQVAGFDVFVPVFTRRDGATRHFTGADQAGAGEADDRLEAAIGGDHVARGEAHGATLRHDQFQAVADGWRIPLRENFEIGAGKGIF